MSRVVRKQFAGAAIGVIVAAAVVVLTLGSLGSSNSKTLGAALSVNSTTSETMGAALNVNGTIDDHGTNYGFSLGADESATHEGQGNVTLFLNGDGLSLCTVHGPGAAPESFPLTQVQCGGASTQAVSITGCKATIEAHGFSHSDFPREAIYLGSMTVEVVFQKKGPNNGDIKVTVYTPKRSIKVEGPVSFGGPVAMSTCP